MGAQIETDGNWNMGGKPVTGQLKAKEGQLIDLKRESFGAVVYPFTKGGTWVGVKREVGIISMVGRVKVKEGGIVLYGSQASVELQLGSASLIVANQIEG